MNGREWKFWGYLWGIMVGMVIVMLLCIKLGLASKYDASDRPLVDGETEPG